MASVVVSFGGREIQTYELSKSAMVVGRDAGADIVIDNLGVSRAHCQFVRRGGGFMVQDMNSANGTYVNGTRVGEQALADNDQIVVGKYVMTFKAAGAAGPAATAPTPATAPAADRVVPDSLNTYMMDGDKIKQRIAEMRKQEQAGRPQPEAAPAPAAASAPAAPVPAPVPAPAAAPAVPPPSPPASAPAESTAARKERHTRIVMGQSRKEGLSPATAVRYLYLSLALNLVLIVAFGILYWFYLKQGG
jgi:predicted component of type VI protein secretion system